MDMNAEIFKEWPILSNGFITILEGCCNHIGLNYFL